jgi:hypothetical protein
VRTLDEKVKMLHNRAMGLVKIQRTYHGPKDATWDNEDAMWEEYPRCFE